MVFRRKIYDQFLRWKQEDNGATALLIEGARRIGKSTIAEEFAKKEYSSYILVDFAFASAETKALFNDISNLNSIFTKLQFTYKTKLIPHKSVIIFDEIQLCPRARQAIKVLVKDGRYHYIETGSLLGIKMKQQNRTEKLLIPSEERRLKMYPMDYEEFRWAMKDEVTCGMAEQAFNDWCQVGDAVNRSMMRDFRLYMLVGGMPQAVDKYIKTLDLSQVDQVKRNILELYDADFYELDPSGTTSMLFRAIPSQLNGKSSRFMAGSAIKGGRLDRLENRIAILKDSMTVNVCCHSDDPSAGLAMHINMDKFKLYCCDTGLFVTLAFWDKDFTENTIYGKLLSDKLSANLGYVYENVVSQMLKAKGDNLYYHTFRTKDSTSQYEIDFLLSRKGKVVPVEVKSAKSDLHKSVDKFQEKYPSRTTDRYLIHPRDLRKDGDLKCLPFYMIVSL